MSLLRYLPAWLAVWAVSLAAGDAMAQARPQPKLVTINLTGKVAGARRGTLFVVARGQNYVVSVGPRSKVLVTGKADAGILKSGMWVRFSTKLDKRGNVTEEIKKLDIFTPSEVARPGIQEEGDGFYVGGQLRSVSKSGSISVNTGKQTVKAQLAEGAEVEIGVRDARWLSRANKDSDITVVGKGAPPTPNSPGRVQAEELELKLGTLSSGKKKPPAKEKEGVKKETKE